MRVLVVGAGAVGGYFAARLHQAGHEVHVVARGEHGAALAMRGIELRGPAETTVVGPFPVSSLEGASGLGAGLALVCVKSSALADVAVKLGPCLGPAGFAVPLLNGLESEQVLAATLGEDRVAAGSAYMSAELLGPGVLRYFGSPTLGLAPLGTRPQPRVAELAESLSAAGVRTVCHEDARKMLWQKMLWNVPFNALCALADCNVAAILDNDELVDLARTGMQETLAVARAEGVDLPESMVDAMLAVTRAQFAETVPSMLQDVRAGRVTEVEILQDAVVTRGKQRGVPTPVTRTLAALVRARHPRS